MNPNNYDQMSSSAIPPIQPQQQHQQQQQQQHQQDHPQVPPQQIQSLQQLIQQEYINHYCKELPSFKEGLRDNFKEYLVINGDKAKQYQRCQHERSKYRLKALQKFHQIRLHKIQELKEIANSKLTPQGMTQLSRDEVVSIKPDPIIARNKFNTILLLRNKRFCQLMIPLQKYIKVISNIFTSDDQKKVDFEILRANNKLEIPRGVYDLLRSNSVQCISSVMGHLCSLKGVAIQQIMQHFQQIQQEFMNISHRCEKIKDGISSKFDTYEDEDNQDLPNFLYNIR